MSSRTVKAFAGEAVSESRNDVPSSLDLSGSCSLDTLGRMPLRKAVHLLGRGAICRVSALRDSFFDRDLNEVLALNEDAFLRETRLLSNFGQISSRRLWSLLEGLRQQKAQLANPVVMQPDNQCFGERNNVDVVMPSADASKPCVDERESTRMFYRDFSSAVLVDSLDLTRVCRFHGIEMEPEVLAERIVAGAPLVSFQCHPERTAGAVRVSEATRASAASSIRTDENVLASRSWGDKGLAGLSLGLSAIRLSRVVERIFLVTCDPAFIPVIKTARGFGAKVYVVRAGEETTMLSSKAEDWSADGVLDLEVILKGHPTSSARQNSAAIVSLVNA